MNNIIPNYSKTKMVATMGPACNKREILLEMIRLGVDVCRLNMSHGDHDFHQQLINLINEINRNENLNVSILLDLQGPKIRMGALNEPFQVNPGDIIKFCTTLKEPNLEEKILPMVCDRFAQDVKPDDMVLVDDGKVELRVIETDYKDTVTLKVISGSEIGSKKGVNLPWVKLDIPALSEKDLNDLHFGIRNKVEWIALSFVRHPKDVEDLRKILIEKQSNAKIISKIEKPEALECIDEIIKVSDAIMIARGDLGVEIHLEDVPLWQKTIIKKCNELAKPVIVATQMLETMIQNPRPTRAETTDVANAVFDGADALMLSGETSVGKYPVEVVRTMQKVISQVEKQDSIYFKNLFTSPDSKTFLSDAVCIAAVKLANGIKAKAIVGMTRSGYTAFQLAKCRPNSNIFIFTDNESLLNTLNLVWGVRAFYYNQFHGTDESIADIVHILKNKGLIDKGDVIINLGSMPLKSRKRTNMLKVTEVD